MGRERERERREREGEEERRCVSELLSEGENEPQIIIKCEISIIVDYSRL